jgi:hypothetical protein
MQKVECAYQRQPSLESSPIRFYDMLVARPTLGVASGDRVTEAVATLLPRPLFSISSQPTTISASDSQSRLANISVERQRHSRSS